MNKRLAVLAISLAAAVFVHTRDPATAAWIARENGPFETASAVFFGLGFVLTAWQYAKQPTKLRLTGALMLCWAALREMDFQKRFTYRSIESLGYYTRPIAPWSEKLLVLVLLLPFVLAGGYLLFQLARRLPVAWAAREPWVGHAFTAIALFLTGSVLEKIFQHGPAEEVCETGASLMVLLLAWEFREKKTPAMPSAPA